MAAPYTDLDTVKAALGLGDETEEGQFSGLSAGMHGGASAGFWSSTSAITRIVLLPGASNFDTGSRVIVIGAKHPW